MTEQEIMQWAVESGLAEVTDTAESLPADYVEALAKFAGLSSEREREACARVCEDTTQDYEPYTGNPYRLNYTCAAAIRARGGKGGSEC